MRAIMWAVLTIAGLAGFSLAQEMPKCATDCLTEGLENSQCEATDFECICADEVLMGFVEDCAMGTCTVIEGLAAKNQTSTLCKEPIRDRSLTAPIATAITGALAIAFVALRLYESYVRKEWQWADLCAVVALMSSIPMDVFEFFMMSEGFGKDTWTLEPQAITNVVKYTWITQVTYIPAIILTKIAILLFFMRVFPDRKFRHICIGSIIYCFLFMISTTIAAILACIPVKDAWRNWAGDTGALCYDNNAYWWAHSALNIATDLWIIGLPIPKLWVLQLGMKKKIYLICMFSVGIVITVISIVRFSGLIQYSATTNPTYNNVMVATYSVIECNISIMCCCMPALYSFLRRVFPTVFGGSTSRSNYKAGSYNLAKSPMPSNGIHKTVEHQVSYIPRAGDSDVVELMDYDGNQESKKYNRW